MARVSVRVDIDAGKLARALGEVLDPVVEHAADRARYYIRSEMAAAGRVNTGKMMEDITLERVSRHSAEITAYRVNVNAPYAIYQDQGTGPIFPVRAKALRFTPKGSNVVVFAKSTRGVPAAHFMDRAVARITVSDFRPR